MVGDMLLYGVGGSVRANRVTRGGGRRNHLPGCRERVRILCKHGLSAEENEHNKFNIFVHFPNLYSLPVCTEHSLLSRNLHKLWRKRVFKHL